jgi:hypothetical protein
MRTTSAMRMCIHEVDTGSLLVVSLQPELGTHTKGYEMTRTRDARSPGTPAPAGIVCGFVTY